MHAAHPDSISLVICNFNEAVKIAPCKALNRLSLIVKPRVGLLEALLDRWYSTYKVLQVI